MPFGNSGLARRAKYSSASEAVTSLTVVNTSASRAHTCSIECLAVMLCCLAASSLVRPASPSSGNLPVDAIERPKMVACVVNTVPTCGTCFFKYSRPEPVIHSWNCATHESLCGAGCASRQRSMTLPAAQPKSTGST